MINKVDISKNNIHELLGYEKIKIVQNDDMFSFSLDSMLLANFINTSGAKRIIDLGTGNAPIPLFLTMKTDALITGVEIQKDVALLAQESVDINNFGNQITIINADLKGIYRQVGANVFDIVSCNPPYFKYEKDSIINKNDFLTIARHEVMVNLKEIIIEAKKLLIDGGKIYLVHRVSRMTEVMRLLEDYKFGIKRMQLIYPKNNEEAVMFLIEAKNNKKSDLKIIESIYVYENNLYTEQVMKIFNFKK